MTRAADHVQRPRAHTIDQRKVTAVKSLIHDLFRQGIRDRNKIAARVRQGHHGFSHDLIAQLLSEAFGEDGYGSGASPRRVELSTSQGGKPGQPGSTRFSLSNTNEKGYKNRDDPGVLDYPGFPTNQGGNTSVPLGDYLVQCVERNRQELRRRRWASPLFHFLRWARAHADLAGLPAVEAFQRIEGTLGYMTAPDCPWRTAFSISRATAESECFALWESIWCPPGTSPLQGALEQARQHPWRLPEGIAKRRPSGYAEFISLAGWLQNNQAEVGDTILLPVEELARLLDASTTAISRYRRWAIEDGFLTEVKPYEFKGKGKAGKATEFRFGWPTSEPTEGSA